MLMDLLSYYYADRLYLLRSVNLILSHRSPNSSDQILQRQLSIKDFQLIDQLEELLKTAPVPARSRDLTSQMISIMHLQLGCSAGQKQILTFFLKNFGIW